MSGPAPEPQVPQAASFERLRRLAKQLTRACRAGDAASLARVRASLPRLAAMDDTTVASRVRLADVHHALAREAGVESWAALKALVQAQEPLIAQVARFVRAFHDLDASTMRRVLDSHPEVARTSIHAACIACDADAVERWLAKDRAAAVAPFRDGGWTPIECVAVSPLVAIDDARRAASVAIAERLLALGADPHAFTLAADGTSKLTALYRASERGNAGLVKLLLERGADPNDGESVYHAAEHNHRDVLELLVAHGAEISAALQPWNNTVLYFLCGYREGQPGARAATLGMEWLLEHGADPNVPSYDHRSTPLHAIAAQGRGAEVARMLLSHRADPRRARADGRTPYELAMRSGNVAVAEVLREVGGAVDALRPVDAVLAACATGDASGARRALDADPGLRETLLRDEPDALVHAAGTGNAAAIPVLASLGYDLGREAREGGTALHWAAWRGRTDVVRALLAAGAPVDPRDRTYGSSPIAWAAHGSAHCREADEDYIAVIDLLLDAGAARDASFNRWHEPPEQLASDAAADHLRARGFAPEE
jgi:ankyrin repeat protein